MSSGSASVSEGLPSESILPLNCCSWFARGPATDTRILHASSFFVFLRARACVPFFGLDVAISTPPGRRRSRLLLIDMGIRFATPHHDVAVLHDIPIQRQRLADAAVQDFCLDLELPPEKGHPRLE